MQRTVLPKSFCLSVCLSDAWIMTKPKKRAHIVIPHERQLILVFWKEKWLEGRPHVPEILGQTDPFEAKTQIFNWYSLVTP